MKFSKTNIIMIITVAFSLLLCMTACKTNNTNSTEIKASSTETPKQDTSSVGDTQREQVNESPTVKSNDQETPSENAPSDAQVKPLPAYQYTGDDPIQKAIADYLIHEIGKQFAPSDVCIPSISIVGIDTTNSDDVRVWGDFWVFNYKLDNDTLLTESGGAHPGLIHLKKSDEGYSVTKMDVVADGADNLKSAKQIFGDKYDAFHKINSNQDEREKVRRQFILDYVKNNQLVITKLKDFGWDPVTLQ